MNSRICGCTFQAFLIPHVNKYTFSVDALTLLRNHSDSISDQPSRHPILSPKHPENLFILPQMSISEVLNHIVVQMRPQIYLHSTPKIIKPIFSQLPKPYLAGSHFIIYTGLDHCRLTSYFSLISSIIFKTSTYPPFYIIAHSTIRQKHYFLHYIHKSKVSKGTGYFIMRKAMSIWHNSNFLSRSSIRVIKGPAESHLNILFLVHKNF